MTNKASVDVVTLRNALSLLETREWPIKYMLTLGKVAQEIEEAILEVEAGNDEKEQAQ